MHFQPEEFHPLPEAIAFEYPEIVSREVSPSFGEWEDTIARFKQSEIEKVVLARKRF